MSPGRFETICAEVLFLSHSGRFIANHPVLMSICPTFGVRVPMNAAFFVRRVRDPGLFGPYLHGRAVPRHSIRWVGQRPLAIA